MSRNKINSLILLFIAIIFMSIPLLTCSPQTNESQLDDTFQYSSFREIPGVTDLEIRAIEDMQRQGASFIYGMTPGTEAFYSNNNIEGFVAIFCEWLTDFFGIPFAPAIYEWGDLTAGLENGEIDFTSELTPTEERRKIYYMTDAMAMRQLKYMRLENSLPISEIAKERPLRLVFYDGSVTYDHVVNSIPYEFEAITASDGETVYELLKSGQADAFLEEHVTEALFDVYGDVVTEGYSSVIFSPVSLSTRQRELEPVISVMQKMLKNDGQRFLISLYNQGSQEYLKYKLLMRLTEQEKEYLRVSPVIKFAAEPDNYPISFYNTQEEQWQGIVFDIIEEIHDLTGLNFQVANNPDAQWPVLLRMLETREASMVTELIRSREREGRFLWPAASIMADNYTLLSKSEYRNVNINEIFYLKVGLTKDTAHTEQFQRLFPNHEHTVEYDNFNEALAALDRGEIEMLMSTQHQFFGLTNYRELSGYKINVLFDQIYESTLGFNLNEDLLCSIVDKTLDVIDVNIISGYWMRRTFNYRVGLVQARIPWLVGATSLVLLLLFFFTLFYRERYQSRRLEKQIQKRTTEIEGHHKLLQTVNLTASAMLSTVEDENFEASLFSGMDQICKTMDVDRVTIWKNEIIDGKLYSVLKYERLSESGKQMMPIPIGLKIWYHAQGEDPHGGKAKWKESLLNDEHINCPISELPPEDREFFRAFEIKSVIFIPLFLHEEFWGLFGIDDCRRERKFTEEEVNILRSASLMMVSAINRHTQAESIREADKLTQLMLEATPLSCHLWDKYGKNMSSNEATVEMYGLTSKQDFIDRFFDLSPEYQPCGRLSKEMVKEAFEKTLERGFSQFEWQHKKLNGEPFPAEITLVRVMHKNDFIIAGYTRDLTDHKLMLSEMEKSRDAAEAASIAKSAFLANMSHEIRTPMNSILGFSELALDGEPSVKTRDYLVKIQINAEWLLQIINDILDISKIESGKMELEMIPFELHELFSSCRTLILPKAVEKGITLKFFAEPCYGKKPMGDPTRLRQVLINLLSNAVKFTKTGMITLQAAIKEKGEKYITICFTVTDTGIGMTPEQINKIFDPFTQGETGTTRKYGGTGLGLAITKNIIELMGGRLLVESTQGVGSKFSFTLMFDTIDVTEEDKNILLFDDIKKPEFKGEILLCEDNVMNQQVICEHLARVGLKTVIADNGKIGVEMVKNRKEIGEKQFDLIFMDIHMPEMDGIEAAKEIHKLNVGIPIVAMTANVMSSDMEVYRESGMNDCVGKPFTSQELWRCLKKYLTPLSMNSEEKETQTEADREFKKTIQLVFLKENKKRFEEIISALETGDIKTAHRIAHTLKGNAAQIGQSQLQKAATEVESQLRDGTNNVTPQQLAALEAELTAVLEQLAALGEE